MRAFIAVEVVDPARARLAALVERMAARSGNAVKWVANVFHITLGFLGEVEEATAGEVEAAIEAAAAGVAPFELEVRGVGAFPSVHRPRVVWAGIEPRGGGPLAGVYERLAPKLDALGFPPEAREFEPHVTLGRAREPHARRRPRPHRKPAPIEALEAGGVALADLIEAEAKHDAGKFVASGVVLFRSELRPTGAIYTPVRTVSFPG